jgi:hypothetical protein
MVRPAYFCAACARLIKNSQPQIVMFAIEAKISMGFQAQFKGKNSAFTSAGNSFPYRC